VGISADKVEDQKKFIQKEKLPYALLADPDRKVIKEFGSLRPTGTAANRDTFVIGKDGTVKKIFRAVKDAGEHPADVLKYVKENLGGK
jgi:thioredoxin-dependent peroxiredoxin